MNILICDDHRAEAEALSKLLSGHCVTVFDNAREGLLHIQSGHQPDVCFLDILMPDMDGIALAQRLRDQGFAGGIVFLTNANDYAAESYRVEALAYLLKPPAPDSVAAVLRKVERQKKAADGGKLFIKTGGVMHLVRFRDISHVEVMLHTVCISFADGRGLEANVTFSEVSAQLLADQRFIQCHRSYIVNMHEICQMQPRDIHTKNGAKIPISKNYADVKKRYVEWAVKGANG